MSGSNKISQGLNTLWNSPGDRKRYLLKNVSITSFCSGWAVICGMILDALILAYFGLGKETDALFVAWAIPLIITNTIDIQASKVLVPMLSKSFAEDGQEATYRLISNFSVVSVSLLSFVSLMGMTFANVLIPMQGPGLQSDTISLSISLSMLLYGLIPIRAAGAILQSVLFHYHHYVFSSLAKAVISTTSIIFVILLHNELGINAVALGFLFGSLIQLAILLIVCYRKGFRYRVICKFNDPKLRYLMKLFLYPLSGHAIGETRVLFENVLASFLAPGSVSILRYASRIVISISGVLLSGTVTATLPIVSHDAAAERFEEMKKTILRGIKLVTLISLPLCTWIIFTIKPLLILLFERGKFTEADAAKAGIIIALMVPYILFGRVLSLTQTPFYGTLDMRTPLISSVISLLTNIAIALLLFRIAGIYSFPIAMSCSAILTTLYMIVSLHRRFGALEWHKLRDFGIRLSGAIFITAFGFMAGLKFNENHIVVDFIDKLFIFLVPTSLGIISFLTATTFLKVIHWNHLWELMKSSKA